jgi:hypothetical protein
MAVTDSSNRPQVEKSRQVRQQRVRAIRDSKRKRKRESDIEDGEVDSEGESFVPIEEKKGSAEASGDTSKAAKSEAKADKAEGAKVEKVEPKRDEMGARPEVESAAAGSEPPATDAPPPAAPEAEDYTFSMPNREEELERDAADSMLVNF